MMRRQGTATQSTSRAPSTAAATVTGVSTTEQKFKSHFQRPSPNNENTHDDVFGSITDGYNILHEHPSILYVKIAVKVVVATSATSAVVTDAQGDTCRASGFLPHIANFTIRVVLCHLADIEAKYRTMWVTLPAVKLVFHSLVPQTPRRDAHLLTLPFTKFRIMTVPEAMQDGTPMDEFVFIPCRIVSIVSKQPQTNSSNERVDITFVSHDGRQSFCTVTVWTGPAFTAIPAFRMLPSGSHLNVVVVNFSVPAAATLAAVSVSPAAFITPAAIMPPELHDEFFPSVPTAMTFTTTATATTTAPQHAGIIFPPSEEDNDDEATNNNTAAPAVAVSPPSVHDAIATMTATTTTSNPFIGAGGSAAAATFTTNSGDDDEDDTDFDSSSFLCSSSNNHDRKRPRSS